MGSISLSSSDFSSFCPSSIFRESLGHSLSSGRPFYPSHPGLPCCPGILGLRAGANSRRPSSGEGWMDCSTHHPPRGGSHSQGKSRSTTSLIWEASAPRRRLSSVLPILPLGPAGDFSPETGTPSRLPGPVRSARRPTSVEKRKWSHLIVMICSL